MTAPPRVLLLVPARTYRATDFILAAGRMHLNVVVASDGALPLGGCPVIPVSPADPEASTGRIPARAGPVDAVVADTRCSPCRAPVCSARWRAALPPRPFPASPD